MKKILRSVPMSVRVNTNMDPYYDEVLTRIEQEDN